MITIKENLVGLKKYVNIILNILFSILDLYVILWNLYDLWLMFLQLNNYLAWSFPFRILFIL